MVRYLKRCTSIDAFGYPISLLYQGESHFNTRIGSFLTIVLQFVFITYCGMRVYEEIDNPGSYKVLNSEQNVN